MLSAATLPQLKFKPSFEPVKDWLIYPGHPAYWVKLIGELSFQGNLILRLDYGPAIHEAFTDADAMRILAELQLEMNMCLWNRWQKFIN